MDFKWLITDYLMQCNCLHSVPQVGHDGMVTRVCWGGHGTLFSGSEDKYTVRGRVEREGAGLCSVSHTPSHDLCIPTLQTILIV